ncbi:MAG TPA: tRNA uridine-5-carboxymethylaminomethyl(34) synthesis GTPase MnmE [Clostridiaceae bacterium]|nr:tRNA uridine-5-carboxymethylaminomethyl(34) synthesis GTPase MnmE [Clostridia bacterium]HJJ11975.1 tRNA uridine-5-carboxymethylaminomethyl(34) synthesis GTPase MnmE [Clostridiaceae bacterium]
MTMSTIAAISTAPGVGGIGIIRLSGEETFNIIEKIFVPKNKSKEIKGYTFKYGNIINPKTNEILDEVLVSYFIKPRSYTMENMCEINSHGGNIVMQNILEVCLENGAELAEPGEFTKRAFLNGRIDLSQAESIIDIINSKTKKESKASLKQLEGFLSKKIKSIRKKIMDVMVDIEANIDYPEYDIEEVTEKKVENMLKSIEKELMSLKNTFDNGKIIKDGINVAIVGKPNAGKSSLLNALLKEERAIVSQYKGTTRDSIEELMNIDGIPIKIIDTAGIREASDEVEKIGIERAKEIADNADLLIAIFDISANIDEEDIEIIDLIKDKKAIIVLNKIDLIQDNINVDSRISNLNKKIIKISALNKDGVEKISETIVEMFKINEINLDDGIIVTNTRHKNLINKAINSTENAQISLENKMPMDIVAIEIKNVLEDLGEITGEDVSENIINEIFAKFCLGK